MKTAVTTEIELSKEDIKQAIFEWLYSKELTNDNMIIDFNGDIIDLTAKVTFTK